MKGNPKQDKTAIAGKVIEQYLDQNPLVFLVVRRFSHNNYFEIGTWIDLGPIPERAHHWTVEGKTLGRAMQNLAERLQPLLAGDDLPF